MKTALEIAMERAKKPIGGEGAQVIKHSPTWWEYRYPTHRVFLNPNTPVKVAAK